ncbi:HEAT repeat domain-containing protein [Thalassoglobus sp. JC818]|uniref:HEAT repeat domain-containing protein n=1 Tax=Thalassoglobus sp. JC818 TaxID=3232136 RepID=UPI003458689A
MTDPSQNPMDNDEKSSGPMNNEEISSEPTNSDESSSGATADSQVQLPNELPPVEPPSAGMIIQLFLIPAVIVAVIVGVYTIFGTLASQELDWRQLVMDVKSENPHVRWRGALGLAQMLDADKQRGEESQNLDANPEIAEALAELYSKLSSPSSPTDEEEKQIEFLSKALGRMNVQDVILPVFREGVSSDRDVIVRKHSLIGIAMLAGSVQESGAKMNDPELVAELVEISREPERLLRHQAAYALGLLDSPAAEERLHELLQDPDQMTRVNSAIALARTRSTDGLFIFSELIDEGANWKMDPGSVKTLDQESEYFERMLMLLNGVKAVGLLAPELSADERTQLLESLDQLSKSSQDAVLNSAILEVRAQLKNN